MAQTLSDGAAAIFAFAAYHQLQSGQPVTKVVIEDGSGHRADTEGQRELADKGLARTEGNFMVFAEPALAMLARVVDAVRSATASG